MPTSRAAAAVDPYSVSPPAVNPLATPLAPVKIPATFPTGHREIEECTPLPKENKNKKGNGRNRRFFFPQPGCRFDGDAALLCCGAGVDVA